MRSLVVVMAFVIACGPAARATPSPSPTLAIAPPTASPTTPPSPSATPTLTPTRTPGPAISGAVPVHYVAIGASDTVGVGSADPSTGSWPSRIAALLPPGSTYRNLGVSGSLAAQAVSEQLPAALVERPDLVTVWLAVNDLNAQVPAKDLAASLTAIVDALLGGTSARIFIGTVPDLRAVPAYASADKNVLLATVQQYNGAITAVAARRPDRVALVDLFTGSADLMTSVTVAADGFHPSDDGYVLIAQRFADAMRRSGVPLR